LLEFGTVVEVKSNKALARVNILGRVTDFLPILSSANSFKREFTLLRVNQQVAVLDDLLILGSIFNKNCPEPLGASHKEIVIYEDGTIISYDSSKQELFINAVKNINIKAVNLNITASKTSFMGGKISHDNVDISKTHIHPQNAGNHYGGNTFTSPPKV